MKQKCIGVFGSIAFDHLYTFDGAIRDFLHSQNPKNVSISLFCKNRIVRDGGCGGNIAHTLSLLETPCMLFGTVGNDAESYIKRLTQQGIETSAVSFTDLPTATASIVTDLHQDQYALFYAGALGAAAQPDLHKTLSALIVSPEDPQRFQFVVETARTRKIPYYCDPGQIITILPTEFLKEALRDAAGLFCNSYELDLITQKIGLSPEKLLATMPFAVITNGHHGTSLYTKGQKSTFLPVKARSVRNVTGCGDAFRAGFLAGLHRGTSLETASQIGTLIATYVVESEQPQIASFSLDDFRQRYMENFGTECPL